MRIIIWIIVTAILALIGYYAGYIDGYRKACGICLDALAEAQKELDRLKEQQDSLERRVEKKEAEHER